MAGSWTRTRPPSCSSCGYPAPRRSCCWIPPRPRPSACGSFGQRTEEGIDGGGQAAGGVGLGTRMRGSFKQQVLARRDDVNAVRLDGLVFLAASVTAKPVRPANSSASMLGLSGCRCITTTKRGDAVLGGRAAESSPSGRPFRRGGPQAHDRRQYFRWFSHHASILNITREKPHERHEIHEKKKDKGR